MIRVSIYSVNADKAFTSATWWDNLSNYYRDRGFEMDTVECQNSVLSSWGAINVERTEYIDFKDEKDLLLFMLRWS